MKIKPPAPPSETKTSPDPTPATIPQTTPKLVIKNLPKEKDKDKVIYAPYEFFAFIY